MHIAMSTSSSLLLRILEEDAVKVKGLGATNNHRQDWSPHIEAVYKTGMSMLYLLRKLRYFNGCSKMLEPFYQSGIARALLVAVVSKGSSIGAINTNRTNKLMNKVDSIVDNRLDQYEVVVEKIAVLSVKYKPKHSLYQLL